MNTVSALDLRLRSWLADGDQHSLCDLLWLLQRDAIAIRDSTPATGGNGGTDSEDLTPNDRATAAPVRPAIDPDSARTTSPDTAEPRPVDAGGAALAADGADHASMAPIRTPAARALPEAASIARALKPLRRRRASRHEFELDEEASVEFQASTGIAIPLLRARRERWLDLALVIDNSPSMLIWRDALIELRRLCERLGAFRDVRVWRLDSASASLSTARNDARRTLGELRSSDGRRLIWIASACLGDAWRGDSLRAALATLARRQPVALMQMLPQSFWRRTALNPWNTRNRWVHAGSTDAGQANAGYRTRPFGSPRRGEAAPAAAGVPIPAFTLEADLLSAWGSLLTRPGPARMPAVLFDTARAAATAGAPAAAADAGAGAAAENPPGAVAERFDTFAAEASELAVQLARLLAGVPLRLPIIRLVQRALLPASGNTQLAELFLSGLVRRLSPAQETDPDLIEFDFQEGLRDYLLSSSALGRIVDVQAVLSDYLEQRFGQGFDFWAALHSGSSVAASQRVFAHVRASVLRRLGRLPEAGEAPVAPETAGLGEEAAQQHSTLLREPFRDAQILCVNDHRALLSAFSADLHQRGASIRFAKTTEEALTQLQAGGFDAVVTDIGRRRDRGLAGLHLLDHLEQHGPFVPTAVLSRDAAKFLAAAHNLGAVACSSSWQTVRDQLASALAVTRVTPLTQRPIWPAQRIELALENVRQRLPEALRAQLSQTQLLSLCADEHNAEFAMPELLRRHGKESDIGRAELFRSLSGAESAELWIGGMAVVRAGPPAQRTAENETRHIGGTRAGQVSLRLANFPPFGLSARQERWIAAALRGFGAPERPADPAPSTDARLDAVLRLAPSERVAMLGRWCRHFWRQLPAPSRISTADDEQALRWYLQAELISNFPRFAIDAHLFEPQTLQHSGPFTTTALEQLLHSGFEIEGQSAKATEPNTQQERIRALALLLANLRVRAALPLGNEFNRDLRPIVQAISQRLSPADVEVFEHRHGIGDPPLFDVPRARVLWLGSGDTVHDAQWPHALALVLSQSGFGLVLCDAAGSPAPDTLPGIFSTWVSARPADEAWLTVVHDGTAPRNSYSSRPRLHATQDWGRALDLAEELSDLAAITTAALTSAAGIHADSSGLDVLRFSTSSSEGSSAPYEGSPSLYEHAPIRREATSERSPLSGGSIWTQILRAPELVANACPPRRKVYLDLNERRRRPQFSPKLDRDLRAGLQLAGYVLLDQPKRLAIELTAIRYAQAATIDPDSQSPEKLLRRRFLLVTDADDDPRLLEKLPRAPFSLIAISSLATDMAELLRELAEATTAAPRTKVRDDIQKNQWGGYPSRNRRTLEARVSADGKDDYAVTLSVRGTESWPLHGDVEFHLHQTFKERVVHVQARGGTAELSLSAWGAFTVGVLCDYGHTQLELDLSELPKAPKRFREA